MRGAVPPRLTYVNDGVGSNATLKNQISGLAMKIVSRRSLFATAVALALVVGLGTSPWTIFLRPIVGQVGSVEHDVPVQVLRLVTVEARVPANRSVNVSAVTHYLLSGRVSRGHSNTASHRPPGAATRQAPLARPRPRQDPSTRPRVRPWKPGRWLRS